MLRCDLRQLLARGGRRWRAGASRTGGLLSVATRLAVQYHERSGPSTRRLAALAGEVGMSRSGFAARFRQLVGDGPIEYLTRWRMLLAGRSLSRGEPVDLPEESTVKQKCSGIRIGYLARGGAWLAIVGSTTVPPEGRITPPCNDIFVMLEDINFYSE